MTAFVKGLAFLCVCISTATYANEALDTVNAAVEEKAEQLDQSYGVLLDSQERQNLQMALIVQNMTEDGTDSTAVEKAKAAIVIYEITDLAEQRKLLIELSAQMQQKGTGHGGEEPDYP
jgi:hypothetical protein